MARHVPLLRRLLDDLPELDDPEGAIASGWVTVGGRVLTNPAARVGVAESIVVRSTAPLRGEAKLRAALDTWDITVDNRVAVDLGAAAGGFTRILLDAGARRVHAVDAGHGQLLGSLRQDERVVNLESTNLGDLTPSMIGEPVDVVTADLSYVSLAAALTQLTIEFAPSADAVLLVKPMFELALPAPPTDEGELQRALDVGITGIEAAGWRVRESMRSPVTGRRGAIEFLVWGSR